MKEQKHRALFRMLADNRARWGGFLSIVLLALLAGAFKAASATLWGRAVDAGVNGQKPFMLACVALMVLFILLDAGRTAVLYAVIGKTTERMFMDVRKRAFRVLTKGEVSSLENSLRSGDLAMRINGDAESLCDIIAGEFSNSLRLIFQAMFAIGFCLFLSWQLSIAYLILLPVTIWLTKTISLPVQKARKAARGSAGKAMNLVADVLGGLQTVKSYGIGDRMQGKFDRMLDQAYLQNVKVEHTAMRLTLVKYAAGVIQLMSLFLVGTLLVRHGNVSIGHVMAFISLSVYISEAFSMLDRMMLSVRNAEALSQRLYEVFDLPEEKDGDLAVLFGAETSVSACNLSFSYREAENAIDRISFRIRSHQKIAFIGPSGCGKSTLTRLICRFYMPGEGELTLFGADASRISLDALRGNIALVTQEAHLFDGTIEENVRFGRVEATRDEIIAALCSAGLWDFVSSLPKGLNTQIGEFGGQLSGGQRQRLCIARAFLKNAHLVILDEATSALDTESERDIQKSLDELLVGRAAIIVAHRLTTVRNADYLYCLEGGRIVEEGSPARLLELRGYYHEMCQRQGLLVAEGGESE